MPRGTEDSVFDTPGGRRPSRTTVIGTPETGVGTGSKFARTPSVRVVSEEDGTVIFVACEDLDSAGFSAVIAVCTDLTVPGVPSGGLKEFWASAVAGTWDGSEPYPAGSPRRHRNQQL
jgi:hypothetical protein